LDDIVDEERGLPGTNEYLRIRVFIGSLGRAISLLPFDLIKPIVALYQGLGVGVLRELNNWGFDNEKLGSF
jgi:hypothetical protein